MKSYVSAIKKTLKYDDYEWQDNNAQIASLTKACKLKNDVVHTRLPISCGMLELIMFEIIRKFQKSNQPYLEAMYLALYALGYYGLMRVGELTDSCHVVKMANVYLATNKDKLMIVLYTSKTHDESDGPQIRQNSLKQRGKSLESMFTDTSAPLN